MLTDRGTEFCGAHDRHEYELSLAVEGEEDRETVRWTVSPTNDHTRTKTKSPRTNGIRERFHKTLTGEVYRVAFRKRIYDSIEALQADLDAWMAA